MVDEFLGLAYHREHGLPVVVFRLFNTVGPRQTGHYGMVVPRFMRQAIRNEPITVYGDGSQRRCFADVADVIDAILQLMERPQAVGNVFNIGNGREEVSILELANRVRNVATSSSEIVFVPYSEAYAPGFEDMERRVPDAQRIHKLTGWKPRISLDATLRRVHEWLKTSEEGDSSLADVVEDMSAPLPSIPIASAQREIQLA
jgi:UDP-glucose 4-epimerase